jgi:hypothetical protein
MDLCYDYALTGMSTTDKAVLFRRIRRKIGEPKLTTELDDSQLEDCVCEAIEEYSTFINNWALENKMSQMLGLPTNIDFTLKFVSNNFGFEKTLARAYGEVHGTSSTSTRELKTASIVLTGNTQNYYIEAGREIQEVLWYTPSFVNLYGLDPLSTNQIAFTEFGASLAGNIMFAVMPVYDTILTATAAAVRNKVRGSEYSYRIIGGPNGTKKLTLYPVPTTTSNSMYISPGLQTPGTIFYNYYDTVGVGGNSNLSGYNENPGYSGGTDAFGNPSQGNGLVSGPSDAKLYNLTYSELNDPGKFWVKKFAQALAKETLGLMRGKFNTWKIPEDEVAMNGETLITQAKADMEYLRNELKDKLEKLNYKAILENNAAIQESVNKTFSFSPLLIWRG